MNFKSNFASDKLTLINFIEFRYLMFLIKILNQVINIIKKNEIEIDKI